MIDAHQHFWRIGEHDCTWPTADLAIIYRDFLPEDLLPLTKVCGVTGTVLVQSQESDCDTDFLLDLAAKSELIKAVVGWVDLASPNVVARIAELAHQPKMRGLRPMLQGLPDDAWILNPSLEPAILAMQQANLSLDALVFPRHLPYLHIFASRYPDLSVVIDHGAKPAIAGNDFQSWADAISVIAGLPHVYCKLSGLLTEASSAQDIDVLTPYVSHLYKSFGSSRLMWGSDWPVLNLAPNDRYADYSAWLALAKQLLGTSDLELSNIFENTARHFYRF